MMKFVEFLSDKVKVNGILHIGAHTAEEEPEYLKLISVPSKIIWVEANPVLVNQLSNKRVVKALITDKDNEERDFIITNHEQSNSVLELQDRKRLFPWVVETGRVSMKTSTVDTLFYDIVKNEGINMLTMDIQGAELLALKGADKCLHHFDVIYTNVNIIHMNKDCALMEEMDSFLEQYGFYRAETLILDGAWGDAIYLKKSLEMCLKEGEDSERIWNMLKHKVKTLVDVGARDSDYSISGTLNCDYHLFEPNEESYTKLHNAYKDTPNVFLSRLALNETHDTLDNYCKKLDIERINFLKIDTLPCVKGATDILSRTDYVLFRTYPGTNITIYDLLYEQGFTYIYYIGKNCLLQQSKPKPCFEQGNYIAMRTTWKEASQPMPKLGICSFNLERSTERRKFILTQLNRLGFPFMFFNGIDGRRIDVVNHEGDYEGMKFPCKPKYSRKLSYGELGCFMAHITSYKIMLKTDNDYFLILEDDNEILDVNLARRQLLNIPNIDFDICLLSASMNTPTDKTEKINEYFYRTSKRLFNRTNAILYTRSGIEKLLTAFHREGVSMPHDDFIKNQNMNIITVKDLLYHCSEHSDSVSRFTSDIWNIYKENEVYTDIKYDKPVYNGVLFANLNGHARMGNCLFQYAFLKAQSIEKNMKIVLPEKCKELLLFPYVTYSISSSNFDKLGFEPISETKFEYDEELVNRISWDGQYIVSGYFQSSKYFEKYRDVIKNSFVIHPGVMKRTKRAYVSLSGGKSLCGVHLRLPDTRGEQDFIYTQPSENYIRKALSMINTEYHSQLKFVVFSNDIEEAITLYSKLFPSDTIWSRMDKNEDFALLSICDYTVITSGSFGWWASYLNNTVKQVICMSPNFNKNVERVSKNSEQDYYPSEWSVIDNE
jgi:GR25 family glycosyltransferase involved in LPS biosynthesis